MKIVTATFLLSTLLGFAGTVFSHPETHQSRYHWQKPGPGDARSPCPGINALANHGILPRSGRNITLSVLKAGLLRGFNFDKYTPSGELTFAESLFYLAVLTNPTPDNGSFDFDRVGRHNFPIESDGSLTRKDAYFGNSTEFDAETWRETWDEFNREGFVNGTFIDLALAARVRSKRVFQKTIGNKELFFGSEILGRSIGASALYMTALGGAGGIIDKRWLESLFGHERLPYEYGWKPSTDDISLKTIGLHGAAILAASPKDIPCTFRPEAACPMPFGQQAMNMH